MKINENSKKCPSEQYLDCVLDIAHKIKGNLYLITEVAEISAERTLEGGTLYIRDKEGAFASEGLGRAGGLMLLRGGPEDSSKSNTILLGSSGVDKDYDIQQVENAHKSDDIVVAFCSSQQVPLENKKSLKELADYSIDNFLPDIDSVVSIEGLDSKICPAALVINAFNLWTFTAEFISACLRRGKMSTMYQSIFCPGSKERNAEVGKEKFHSDLKIKPIDPEVLGKEYIDEMIKEISQIKETQIDNIKEASSLAAEAIINGKKAYADLMGHMPPKVPGGPGDPGIWVTQDFSDDDLQKGDFIALIEYIFVPRERLDVIKAKGARSVWVGVPMEDDLDYPSLDLFINPFWKFGDAIVEIPGYDVKVLPPSGVIQSMIYWLLVGETAQICVEKGLDII